MRSEKPLKHLQGDLVKERILLPGWDPSDPVPAVAVYPSAGHPLPVVFLFHGIHGRKEALEPWAEDLAGMGFYVLAADQHLHGERAVSGVMDRKDLSSLGNEYSIYVHQSAIAHTAMDFPVMVDYLESCSVIDIRRLGVAGISMGGSLSLVLAWKEKRLAAVASLIGACDFWWDVTKTAPGEKQEAMKEKYGLRLRRLVDSIDPWPRMSLMPPKALAVINGRDDKFIDIVSIRRFAAEMRRLYAESPDRFCFAEEPVAHHATDTMKALANEWFARFLKT